MTVNFSGTWIADISKSTFMGPTPKALRVTIDHSDPELYQQLVSTDSYGKEQRIEFRYRTEGLPVMNSLNDLTVRASARWQGSELVVKSQAQLGVREAYCCDCWSLSQDGKFCGWSTERETWLGSVLSSKELAHNRSWLGLKGLPLAGSLSGRIEGIDGRLL